MQDASSPNLLKTPSSIEESNPASMPSLPPRKRSSKSTPRGSAKRMRWFFKPAFIALVLIVAGLTLGWGAYGVLIRPTAESDQAELADLEDFDLESPSLGQGEPTDELPSSRPGDSLTRQQHSTPLVEQAPQLPALPSAGSFELPPLSALPSFQATRYERDPAGRSSDSGTHSGAWLSGTIEVAEEANSRIALPARISQTEFDGPAIR